MRSLVVTAALLAGLALAPEAGAAEGPRDLTVFGSLATVGMATGGVEESAIHYAGLNMPPLSANQRQRLDSSDPARHVGVS